MTIRWVDRVALLGQIATTLDGVSCNAAGTSTNPVSRTGVLTSQLGLLTASFVGFFTAAPNRTGSIASTLGGVSLIATGTFAGSGDPVWQTTVGPFALQVGVPFSLDLDTVCSDPNSDPINYGIVTGTLPAGLTQSGARNNIIAGTPTTAQSGVLVTFSADDQAGVVVPSWSSSPVL